jgi:pyridoxine 5-phosphate synthase
MTKLSVNLNKIALLRNARAIGIPSVLEAAQTCVRRPRQAKNDDGPQENLAGA